MGAATTVILKVETPDYGKVTIEASDGLKYFADLRSFSKVYCYPKTRELWSQLSIDSYGRALIWTTRFEAHIDQIIGLAFKTEKVQKSA